MLTARDINASLRRWWNVTSSGEGRDHTETSLGGETDHRSTPLNETCCTTSLPRLNERKKEMYASSSLTVQPVVLKTLRDLHQLQSLCRCCEIFFFVWIKSENIIQHFIIASMSTTNNHESQTTAPTFKIILSPNRYCHAVTDRVWAMKITAN